jgi:hypothetical protein
MNLSFEPAHAERRSSSFLKKRTKKLLLIASGIPWNTAIHAGGQSMIG